MPNEAKNLADTLNELMESQAITIDKIAASTNIPMRFLVAMEEGEMDKLPAEPYVRGYLSKIATVLKAEPQTLISAYKESVKNLKSKEADKLPTNRFAKTPIKRGWILSAAIIAFIGITGFARFNAILGVPDLHINLPDAVSTESILIAGSVRPGDRVTLNGEPIFTDEEGKFEESVPLAPGLNTMQFKVRRFLGRESVFLKQIYYNAPSGEENAADATEINVF